MGNGIPAEQMDRLRKLEKLQKSPVTVAQLARVTGIKQATWFRRIYRKTCTAAYMLRGRYVLNLDALERWPGTSGLGAPLHIAPDVDKEDPNVSSS